MWKTANGEYIPIEDLTDRHIDNIIIKFELRKNTIGLCRGCKELMVKKLVVSLEEKDIMWGPILD